MMNYFKGCLIGISEIVFLFVSTLIVKNVGYDPQLFSMQAIFTQTISLLTLPVLYLFIFKEESRTLFVVKKNKLLLMLAIIYCIFFIIRWEFNIKGIYMFIQMLFIVGFSEEFIYRGLVYSFLKKKINI